MRKPHLLHVSFLCHFCRFIKCHMFIFYCFCFLLRLTIHSFTDKQIRTFCMVYNRCCRSCICSIRTFNSFSCRSKNQITCQYSVWQFNGFPLLQAVPVLHFYIILFCFIDIKLTCSINLYRISITGYIVIHTKCRNPAASCFNNFFFFF